MKGLTVEQIIQKIANANKIDFAVMRQTVEQTVLSMIADISYPPYHKISKQYTSGKITMDQLIDMLEFELYEKLLPKIPGWRWDGEKYVNLLK